MTAKNLGQEKSGEFTAKVYKIGNLSERTQDRWTGSTRIGTVLRKM